MVKEGIDDKRIGLIINLCVFLCGVGLILIGVLKFVEFDFSEPAEFFLHIYYMVFGVLCILMELPWERTLLFFAFLRYYIGKAVFLLFCGTLVFAVDPWYQMIVGIIFFITGCLYLFLAVTCKKMIVDKGQEKEEEPAPKEQPKQEQRFEPAPDLNIMVEADEST